MYSHTYILVTTSGIRVFSIISGFTFKACICPRIIFIVTVVHLPSSPRRHLPLLQGGQDIHDWLVLDAKVQSEQSDPE